MNNVQNNIHDDNSVIIEVELFFIKYWYIISINVKWKILTRKNNNKYWIEKSNLFLDF